MSTKPMLQQAWATGELIDELAATRQAFGYTGLAGSTPHWLWKTNPQPAHHNNQMIYCPDNQHQRLSSTSLQPLDLPDQ